MLFFLANFMRRFYLAENLNLEAATGVTRVYVACFSMTKCFPSSNFKSLYGLLYSSARTWHICKRLTRVVHASRAVYILENRLFRG